MRIIKRHPLLKLATDFVIDSPTPSNISYWWNVGSLLGVCLIIQIVTGVTLAMHYNPSVLEAFNSVEHIMRDVNNGWLIRYLHSNTASAFFFLVYLHIGRGLYYGSYKAPRTLTWTLGTVIFIIMMATAFLGYVLPYGQMSLWGATVITNLMSAIPWIGQDIVEFIWGGFSVNNATLNRFFSLHFVLPFVIAALALMHLIALHDTAGSSNPLGVSANYDKVPFAPYFIFKDLITIFIFMWVLSVFVFFLPNVLGDSENYVMANPMQTPPAIVPEWYLLPFYAILRSIPNKLMGVIAMFSAILIILTMSFTDLGKLRGTQFKPFSKVMFFIFVANLLLLMVLGAKHVESPFIEFGQIATLVYFSYFLLFVPTTNLIENSLTDLYLVKGKVDSYAKNNNDVWLEVPHITIAVMLICIYLFIYLYYNLGFTTYYCVDAPNSNTIPTKAEEKILTYTEFLVSKYSNYCLCGLNNDDLVLISDVVQRMAEESLTGDTRFCPGAPTGSDRNQILGKIFSPRGAEFLRHIYSTGDSFEELLRFKGLPVDRSRIFAELLDGFPRFKPGERCYSVIDTKYIELKAHKLGSMGWIVPKGLAAEFMHPTTSTQLPNPGFAYSKPQSSVVPGSIVSQALRPEVIFIGSEYPEAGPSNMLFGHAGSASSAAPQPVAPSASSHSILSQVELRQKGSSQTSFSNTEQMNVDESSNRGLQRKAESSDTSSYDRKGKKRVRCSS